MTTSGLLKFSEFDDLTPPYNMYRLRTTWCVAAMQVLPVGHFLRAAGLKTMSSLDPYLPHVDLGHEEEFAPALREVSF